MDAEPGTDQNIYDENPEEYFLAIAPSSVAGKRGRELINGYFRSCPESIPRKTTVRQIAKVVHNDF